MQSLPLVAESIDMGTTQLLNEVTPFMNAEQSIDPNVLKELFKMRQRVGKHTIARRERAKSRISKRKNKR